MSRHQRPGGLDTASFWSLCSEVSCDAMRFRLISTTLTCPRNC